jgi:prefoldin subunit 5
MSNNSKNNSKLVVPVTEAEAKVRSREEVLCEIGKVINAKKAAEKKILRCDKRLVELTDELQHASQS